ncbi:MAG: hypothetical protein ABIQ56_07495 [Chitinophagaceae bacterium]
MNSRNTIQDELKTISPLLADLEKVNVFDLPAGYFNKLPDALLEKCIFQSTYKTQPTEVPEGYFTSLADNILAKIKALEPGNAALELRKLSPMLYALQNEEVYKIPRGYFENLADNTMARVSRQARVIALKPVSLWKYAVAAVVTGIIAVSSLWFSDKKVSTNESVAVAFEKSAIDNLLKESANYTSQLQITSELATLPNDAIMSYLENTGTVSDFELLASTIEQQNLPSQDDYLLDEKALDKYLAEINSTVANN